MVELDPATPSTQGRTAVLAVDLGASNVKMAWLDKNRIVDSSERDAEFPAVVAWHRGDLQVGKDALELSAQQPAAVLLHVREWLGLVPSVRLAGVDVRIDEAITALYRNAARQTVRTTDMPASIIVHPAPWPERRVVLLTDAARAAGLDVIQVVPDAVAVAGAGPRDGDVLVIDVGSSLTVSVVDAAADPPRILWSRSSVGAGGEAIAQAIRAVTQVPVTRARALARGAEPDENEEPVDWRAVRRQADDGVAAAGRLINEVLLRSNRDAGAIARIYITGGASVAPFVHEAVRNRMGPDRADRVSALSGPSASAAYGALRLFTSTDGGWGDRAVTDRASESDGRAPAIEVADADDPRQVTVERAWPGHRTSDPSDAPAVPDPDEPPFVGASSTVPDDDPPNTWPASTYPRRVPSDTAAAAWTPSSSIAAEREPTSGEGAPPSAGPSDLTAVGSGSPTPVDAPPEAEPDEDHRPRRRCRRLALVLAIIMAILIGLMALLALGGGGNTNYQGQPAPTATRIRPTIVA